MADGMRLIGAVAIKVRPDTRHFKGDVKEQLRNLPEGKVKVKFDVDATEARKAVDKVDKELKDKKLTLSYGVDYDSIRRATAQVESALKNLSNKTVTVDLDEGPLTKKLAELQRAARGAQVTLKINEDEAGFKSVLAKIEAIRRAKLEQTITFKTDNKSLAKEAAKYKKLLDDLEKNRTVTITHTNDRASLEAAIKQVDGELEKLRKKFTFSPKMNPDELNDTRARLEKMLKEKPLVMKINEDKAGFEKVLAKIEALQAEAAAIDFKFQTDAGSLAVAAAAVKAKIEELTPKETISFKYENDTRSIQKAMDEVNAKLKELDVIELTANLDREGLEAAKAELEHTLANSSFEISVNDKDVAQLKAERAKLEALLSDRNRNAVFTVDADDASIEETKRKFDQMIAELEAKPVELKTKAATWDAAMQLAYASRPRVVPFFVRVNARSLAIAEGMIQSLAGINVLRDAGNLLEDLVTKFDTFALRTTAISGAIGSIADVVAYLGTSLFTVGEGIVQSVGLLAMAPAMVAAITTGVLVNIAAFDNFKSAIDGNAEALAALPPIARETALALQGTWTEIQEPTQAAFWEGMGFAMRDSFAKFIPVVRDGFADVAVHAGRFGAEVFKSIENAVDNGELRTMFTNIEGFFANATGAALPLSEAIGILGLRGSSYLPRFGDWLTEITEGFRDWIKEADEAGRINEWIDKGVDSLHNMYDAGIGIAKMFQGITRAANMAGAGNLEAVADELNRIGDIMRGEPFQSRMVTIFKGAREGASELNVGVKALGETMGEAAAWTGELLEGLGKVTGQALSGFARSIAEVKFQDGILDSLNGMSELLYELTPGFESLGNIVGDFGTLAGVAFSNLAPLVNQVTDMLEQTIGSLGDELGETIPNLISLVSGFLESVNGPLEIVVGALESVLGFVNDLPSGFRDVVTAIVPMLLLARQVGPIFQAKPGGLLEAIKWDFQHATTAAGKFKGVMRGLGAGLMGALGGPWGIAIGAATVGLSLFGQAQADARARVDEHTAALDAQTGKLTDANDAIVASALAGDKGAESFLWLSQGYKGAGEAISDLGWSVEDTAGIVARGGKEYEDMLKVVDAGIAAFDASASSVDAHGLLVEGNANAMTDWEKTYGLASGTAQKFSQQDLMHLKTMLEQQGSATADARREGEMANDTMHVSSARAEALATQLGILNDNAASGESKVRALREALDILNGKTPDLDNAIQSLNDSMRETDTVFKDTEGNVANLAHTLDADVKGRIDTTTEAGSRLRTSLQGVQDDTLMVAQAMSDAGAPAEEIKGHLEAQRQAWIDSAAASLGSKDAAGAVWDYMMNANPGQITTLLSADTSGVESGVQTADDLLRIIEVTPRIAKITGDNEGLAVKYAESMGSLETLDKTISTAHADLNPAELDAKRKKVHQDLITLAKTDPTVRAMMDPAIFLRRRDEVQAKIDDLARQKPTPEVKAETAAAKAQLEEINRIIATIPSHRTVGVHTSYTESGPKPPGAVARVGVPQWYADGGFHDPRNVMKFANGGFYGGPTVRHFAAGGFDGPIVEKPGRAKIYRAASQMRVFAEEETGGEAYIPLAANKRVRSVAILGQVAQQFGLSLTKAQNFADGGIITKDRTGGGVAVNIGQYNQTSQDTVDDVARAIMRRVKTQGMYTPMESF